MLFSWVRGLREAKIVARYVQALLDRCTQRIEIDIITPAAELPRAEARGYLRAKAMHRLVAALGTKNDATIASIPARLHETVLASAVDRLTAVLWRHRELRKAAIVVRRAA